VVNGAVVDAILARTNSSNTTAWYLSDKLGSVREIVGTSDIVLDQIVYDSFGNIVTETNATNWDRFKFARMEYDAATRLYDDRARYYNSACGRFAEQDPMGFTAGDTNLFRYVGNCPTAAVDPSGMGTWWDDYKFYLNPLNVGDPKWGGAGWKIGKISADVVVVADILAIAVVTGTGAGGTVLGGGGTATSGATIGTGVAEAGVAAGGPAALGIGTTAVVGSGLGAGTYPALLINGVVYVHRFHVLALELAGGAAAAGNVTKYGIAIIDATGTVIGWL
jgi:RHS repeat-associated protein